MRMRGRVARRSAGLAVVLTALAGCIGMETTIAFQSNGDGIATIEYRVSQFITKLGTGEGEAGRVPLPITRDDFEQAVSRAPGVSIRGDVRREETESDITLVATLGFDKIESLTAVQGFESMPATLAKVGDRWIFTQVISQGTQGEPIDQDAMQMVRTLFADYDLTFNIEAPSTIRSTSLGQTDASGRRVSYRVAIADLLQMTERTVLEVVW